ncbi:MAG: hypothetical protein KDK78_05610 [Chlamydiia bacterium]|nr:hypothetical protein [Chlamydiia bacterium]
MTSSRNRILRGVVTDGVVFCSPQGDLESGKEQEQRQEDQLKTLEDFWYQKGLSEGRSKGYDEGLQEGREEGRREGLDEGLTTGREEGHAQGLEEGYQKGQAEASEALHDQIRLIGGIAQAIELSQQELLEHGKPEIIRFCLAVCSQVLRRELRDPDLVKAVLLQLIDQAKPVLAEARVQVSLAPSDFEALQPSLDAFSKDAPLMHFAADKSLPQGDFRIEAPMGLVNFDIKRQMEILEKRVLEVHDAPVQPSDFHVDLPTLSEESVTDPHS